MLFATKCVFVLIIVVVLWKDGGLEEKENQFKESSGKLRDLFKVVQPHQRFVRFRPTLSIEYQSWIDNTPQTDYRNYLVLLSA